MGVGGREPAEESSRRQEALRDPRLAPDRLYWQTLDEMEALVGGLAREEIETLYADDAWCRNLALSVWEYVHHKTRLTTYPWNLALAITSTCNAKCVFCSVPMRRTRSPAMAMDLETIPHLETLLRYNRTLLITGGEPTIHPRFAPMLRRMRDIMDPRAYVTLITHGDRLHRFKDELSQINVNFVVSLNAATPSTHEKLMRLGDSSLPRVIESIRWARSIGRTVDVSCVVVRENLSELPDLISLAEDLGCHGVYLRTLIPGDYYAAIFPTPEAFDGIPPWRHPEFEHLKTRAREAIAAAKIHVFGDPDQWGARLQSAELPPGTDRARLVSILRDDPPLSRAKGCPLKPDAGRRPVPNPYDRLAPFACSYPWYAIKLLDPSQRIFPCSFIQTIDGHEDIGLNASQDFFELWNSPAMVHLRQTLYEGPLVPECITCPSQMGGAGQCQSDKRGRAWSGWERASH